MSFIQPVRIIIANNRITKKAFPVMIFPLLPVFFVLPTAAKRAFSKSPFDSLGKDLLTRLLRPIPIQLNQFLFRYFHMAIFLKEGSAYDSISFAEPSRISSLVDDYWFKQIIHRANIILHTICRRHRLISHPKRPPAVKR